MTGGPRPAGGGGRATRWARGATLGAAALLATGCGAAGHPRLPRGTPIVLVSIDTLRSDRLPAYGYARGATPALDRLAAGGVLFERAYSHVPLTLPSHSSVLTGLLPPGHGVRDNLGYRLRAAELPYLPRFLAERGYATGAAVSAFVLRGTTGLAASFDHYDDAIQVVTDAALGALQRPGAETAGRALAWVETVRERPFFLFLHIYEPHAPYAAPAPYDSLYPDAYDGEVAAADEAVGRLLAGLTERGLYDRALIVLLSDHGEGLGDHGEQEHELLIYRESLQVPLIVKLPGGARAGERVADPVGLTDVFPTIARLLGEEPPAGLAGLSLFDRAGAEGRAIYSESAYARLHFGWADLASLVQGGHHFIAGPDPELYDLAADPAERRNLLREERRLAADLRERLDAVDRTLAPPGDEDPATRQRLAALGYVGRAAAVPDAGPPPDPKARLGVLADLKAAFAFYTARDYPAATRAFERVLAAEPRMVDAWEHLGKSRQRAGDLDGALAALQQAAQLAGGAPHVALGLAELHLERGELAAARAHAEVALAGHDVARDLLAQIALAAGDLATAEPRVAEALAHRGTRVGPLLLAARLRFEQGRYAEAIARTVEAEREFGERPDRGALTGLYAVRGKAYARLGEAEQAERAFLRGIERTPADLDCYTHLAYLYALLGRGAQAGAVLRRMVAANDRPPAFAAAVRALRAMEDPRSAAAVLAQARRRWPGSRELSELGG